jgi:hypothetical protein
VPDFNDAPQTRSGCTDLLDLQMCLKRLCQLSSDYLLSIRCMGQPIDQDSDRRSEDRFNISSLTAILTLACLLMIASAATIQRSETPFTLGYLMRTLSLLGTGIVTSVPLRLINPRCSN